MCIVHVHLPVKAVLEMTCPVSGGTLTLLTHSLTSKQQSSVDDSVEDLWPFHCLKYILKLICSYYYDNNLNQCLSCFLIRVVVVNAIFTILRIGQHLPIM